MEEIVELRLGFYCLLLIVKINNGYFEYILFISFDFGYINLLRLLKLFFILNLGFSN